MADLICVAFYDSTTADRVLVELTALQKEYLIKLQDACVVVRPPEGTFISTRRRRLSGRAP